YCLVQGAGHETMKLCGVLFADGFRLHSIHIARLIRMKKRERIGMGFRLAALCLWIFVFSAEVKTQSAILDRAVIDRARLYEPIIKDAASRHGVDERLLWVIAYLESRFNPELVSRKGARGMMQLMPKTATRFGLSDPHNPEAAIDTAARYIRFLA